MENKIKHSVEMQIQSDVSTGAFLSGGIDSSLVVSLMNKISNKKINTFSIGFEDQNYDESNYSKQIAEYLNTNHHCHIFKSKELLGLIENLSDVYDEPFADSSQLPTILLSKFARKHVKVALTGDGADELFGGYNRYNYLFKIFKYAKIFPLPIRHKFIKLVSKLPPSKLYKFYTLINFIFFIN